MNQAPRITVGYVCEDTGDELECSFPRGPKDKTIDLWVEAAKSDSPILHFFIRTAEDNSRLWTPYDLNLEKFKNRIADKNHPDAFVYMTTMPCSSSRFGAVRLE